MASKAIIELDSLLKPVSKKNPAGDDIRDSSSATSPYFTIKDARNTARSAERTHMFDTANSEADQHWHSILDLAPDILENQAKDLEIASWYTEALLRRHGFQGLRDGFKLILGLIEQYWDNLYPMPDEDGIETRVASLSGLNGEGSEGVLIAPIRNVEITQGNDPGPYSYWKYQQALDIDKTIDEAEKKEKVAKLGFSLGDIDQAVVESDEAFFVDLRDDISNALETYREISQKLDEHCSINDSPPTSNIINTLQDCLGVVKHIGRSKLPTPETELSESTSDSSAIEDQASAASPGASHRPAGPIKTRQDAFKQLKDISDFFRSTEPHSPISYIIERAVRWGDMPLDSLIKELIPDPSARDVFGSLTGVKSGDGSS